MDTPNVIVELDLLHLHRPVAGASDAVVAAWYREKAIVLDHLGRAAEAVIARAHADRLAPAAVKAVAA